MLNQKILDRLLQLNQEHTNTASSSRRREIEEEILKLIPPQMISHSPEATSLQQMHSTLVEQLSRLDSIASQGEIYTFIQQIKTLQESIQQYASLLGVKITPVDIEAIEGQLLTRTK